MSISITRYVDITSAVGAGNNASTRDLVARFFTASALLPPQTFVQFTDAAQVSSFFGTASEEAARAAFYFSYVSKNVTQANAIQYARWTNVAVAPAINSPSNNGATAAAFTSISDGSFGITINGVVGVFTDIDFTGDSTLQDIAATLQTAVRTGTGTMFTSATVVYNGAGGFLFTGGVTGSVVTTPTISVQGDLGGTDITIVGELGWLPAATFVNGNYTAGALTSPGSDAETVTQTLTNSANNSNNFGSFLFLNNLNLSSANAVLAAQWNLTQNNMYLFCSPVTPANYSAWQAALATYGGTSLTLSGYTVQATGIVTDSSNVITGLSSTAGLQIGMPVSGANIPTGTVIVSIAASPSTNVTLSANATGSASEVITFTPLQFPEQIPMMVEAATNYTAPNAVQNYMFQGPFAGLTPLVTSDTLANTYDALSINYYGSTQTAGQVLNFYQRGVLQGVAPSPLDINTYVNEIWLKDACTVAIMNLFLNLAQLPANQYGRSQLLATLQTVINQALLNGTISVNKVLTTAQQLYITTTTNDPDAWYQVQTIGYWLDAQIVPSGSPVVYTATYTLIYSKDDVIRMVTGSDILI